MAKNKVIPNIKVIHYNNSLGRDGNFTQAAEELLKTIVTSDATIKLYMDDGDGDIWEFTIETTSKLWEQIKE